MKRMPVLFIGHGSPMNAIEENKYTKEWEMLGTKLPRPEAILSVSAHWFTPGTRTMDSPNPNTIYDMYGFPDELYAIRYDAPGSAHFAHITQALIERDTTIDNTWGLDHGTWTVLHRIYPDADIPVFQLSVDRYATPEAHFQIGRDIHALREQGVLILGSGNVVHNLAKARWNMDNGYSWAEDFDNNIKNNILNRNYYNVIHYEQAGQSAALAFTMPDHYAPLLYVLGASDDQDEITVFNDSCVLGSLSMTSYLFE